MSSVKSSNQPIFLLVSFINQIKIAEFFLIFKKSEVEGESADKSSFFSM
jgi:hypothetical protein